MKRARTRIGRPPRTDRPEEVTFVLPGKLRQWLRRQAGREQRDQGSILASALADYRASTLT